MNQKAEAADRFKQATQIEKQNAQYWYVYGLSMESFNGKQAADALGRAFGISGNPQHLFAQCDMLLKYQSNKAKACINELQKYAPANMINSLNQRLNQVSPH